MTTEQAVVSPVPWRAHAASSADDPFAEFYAEYYGRVARYCWRLVRDEQVAHDLAQEALARLYLRWVGVRDPAAFVFHVATNLVRDAMTRKGREATALGRLAPAHGPDDHRDVHLAVGALPRRYREVVLLYYFGDLPVAEVAAAVRRPEGTVKRYLKEARELLAESLEGHA